eukprot:6465259-Amphidinium_carterae.2
MQFLYLPFLDAMRLASHGKLTRTSTGAHDSKHVEVSRQYTWWGIEEQKMANNTLYSSDFLHEPAGLQFNLLFALPRCPNDIHAERSVTEKTASKTDRPAAELHMC